MSYRGLAPFRISRPTRLPGGKACGLTVGLVVGLLVFGVHIDAPAQASAPVAPLRGTDVARDLTSPADGSGGHTLDALGHLHAAALGGGSKLAGIPTPIRARTPTATHAPTATPTATLTSQAVDIYAFTGSANPAAKVASLPSVVDGVSWVFGWKDIEAKQGVYDWRNVDAAIAASSSTGRKTMLRIIPGGFSPVWIPNQLTFSFQPLGGGPIQTVTMPKTWDPTYISAWTTFIRAYGARYDGDARLTMIQMPGGGYQGEMTLPQWPGWVGAGYTDALMTGAWDQFIDAYRAAFPKHPTVLDFGEPLETYAQSHIVPAVLAHAATYGSAVRYQQNGLRSGLSQASPQFKTVLALSSSTTVGWQMWGSGGSSGDLMTCFKMALVSHAGYVEVYLDQAVNPADLPAFTYLAGGG